MTFPHQCRCAICGEIGMIAPGLPNVFADLLNGVKTDTPPDGIERRALVPTETNPGLCHECDGCHCMPHQTCACCKHPRPVGMVPALGAPFPFDDLATCTHGYTRCMICKFPAP